MSLPENNFKIRDLRLVVSDQCPYSCIYCGVYCRKALKLGIISQEEFDSKTLPGNEGSSVKDYKSNNNLYLTPEDYKFLLTTLSCCFGVEDVTFSGGDPFTRKDIKELINIAASLKLRTTAITKGLPLFSRDNKNLISEKTGKLDRVIFSLDTLDPEKHADINLSLMPKKTALLALSKTLDVIQKISKTKCRVDINSVILLVDFNSKKELNNSFLSTQKIIQFALENNVERIKFIELDSEETLGNPYIEEYFRLMKESNYLKKFDLFKKWTNPVLDFKSQIIDLIEIKRKNKKNLLLSTYRTHCPTTFLRYQEGNKAKGCDLFKGGELNIDSTGGIITCQRIYSKQKIEMRKHIVNRDAVGIIESIKAAAELAKNQDCLMHKLLK